MTKYKILVRHKGPAIVQGVVHIYMSGRVRTSSGDVWDVERVQDKDKEYDFVSVSDDWK